MLILQSRLTHASAMLGASPSRKAVQAAGIPELGYSSSPVRDSERALITGVLIHISRKEAPGYTEALGMNERGNKYF